MSRTFGTIMVLLLSLTMLACQSQKAEERYEDPVLEGLPSPAQPNSSLPNLQVGGDSLIYLSWVEKEEGNTILKYAGLGNWDQWSKPEIIASGDNWFVNWADFPGMSVNKKGDMISYFLVKSGAGTYAYDVNIVTRRMDSNQWTGPLIPHKDGTNTEHGFVTAFPVSDKFFLTWLDGRNTGGPHHDGHEHNGAMTIRSAILDMEGNLYEEMELDARVCDCCQTGGVMTDSGPVVVYRDRSEEEVRDISIVRRIDGAWSEPQIVYADNWKIAGCPVNGPRADAIGNSLAVAWFTAAKDHPVVKVIFSHNGGETFGIPATVETTSALGRVDVAMIDKKSVMVSWLSSSEEGALIKAARFNAKGLIGEEQIVAKTSADRGSGFPQMVKLKGGFYFAWTDTGGSPSIKLAKMSF